MKIPKKGITVEGKFKLVPLDNPGLEERDQYLHYRVRDPSRFSRIRTIIFSKEKGIKARVGRLKGEKTTKVQSIMFDKDKWSEKRARAWIQKHEGEWKT